MGVLAWYVAKIWPSEFGTHEPFYFLCLPSYWKSCFGIKTRGKFANARVAGQDGAELVDKDLNVETVTENLERQVADGVCVDIIDLYKEFDIKGGKKVAVDGLNLTMYSGQITALLGHNGAGKVIMMMRYRLFSYLLFS